MSVTIIDRDGEDLIEITIATIPFYGVKKAYWGWMDTANMLTEAQIVVLQGSGDFAAGSDIAADFRLANTSPMYLYMAEQVTEPVKTIWYGSALDQGLISPGQVFSVVGVVGSWRVYRSTQKTTFSTTTQFKV